MPQEALYDDDDTAELYENTVELDGTSPELPVDARAIVEWRKEASKSFKCGIPQTVSAVDPYATAEQRTAPARVYKRTLDDMRRMSEQIKRYRELSASGAVPLASLAAQDSGMRAGLGLLLRGKFTAFIRLLRRRPEAAVSPASKP